MEPIRVAIVEDNCLLRHLLADALNRASGVQVVGAFAEPGAALAAIPDLNPCVVVLEAKFTVRPSAPTYRPRTPTDRAPSPAARSHAPAGQPSPVANGSRANPSGQPMMNGFELGRALRRRVPELGIVLLSDRPDPEAWTTLPPDETVGWSYLLKKSVQHIDTLLQTIRGTRNGLVVLDPELVAARQNSATPLARLTRRQRQVLELLSDGLTNGAIARQLDLSEKTIQNQINLIYDKLDIDRCGEIQPRVRAAVTYWQYR